MNIDMSSEMEGPLVEFESVHGHVFKNLFSNLKAAITEANFIFTKEGVKMCAMDSLYKAFIHLFIPAEKFSYYICNTEKTTGGIYIEEMSQSLQSIKSNDVLKWTIPRNRNDRLVVSITSNYADNIQTIDYLTLLNLEEVPIRDQIKVRSVPEMESKTFQTIFNDMAKQKIGEVQITFNNDMITFKAVDSIKERMVNIKIMNEEPILPIQTTSSSTSLTSLTSEQEQQQQQQDQQAETNQIPPVPLNNPTPTPSMEPVSGTFAIGYLKAFSKSTNLSNRVRLFFKRSRPFFCEYVIPDLGVLRYALVPKELEGAQNPLRSTIQ